MITLWKYPNLFLKNKACAQHVLQGLTLDRKELRFFVIWHCRTLCSFIHDNTVRTSGGNVGSCLTMQYTLHCHVAINPQLCLRTVSRKTGGREEDWETATVTKGDKVKKDQEEEKRKRNIKKTDMNETDERRKWASKTVKHFREDKNDVKIVK